MNIALFAHSGAFGSLHILVRWLKATVAPARQGGIPLAQGNHWNASKSIAASAVTTRDGAHNRVMVKPLRIVHVLEAGQNRSGAGRIVISGRMADVCAELDRLAAGEASLS